MDFNTRSKKGKCMTLTQNTFSFSFVHVQTSEDAPCTSVRVTRCFINLVGKISELRYVNAC